MWLVYFLLQATTLYTTLDEVASHQLPQPWRGREIIWFVLMCCSRYCRLFYQMRGK